MTAEMLDIVHKYNLKRFEESGDTKGQFLASRGWIEFDNNRWMKESPTTGNMMGGPIGYVFRYEIRKPLRRKCKP